LALETHTRRRRRADRIDGMSVRGMKGKSEETLLQFELHSFTVGSSDGVEAAC